MSWPEACRFDDGPSDYAEPRLGPTNRSIFKAEYARYQLDKAGSTSEYLSREQEYELAEAIQDGLVAEELLEGAGNAAESSDFQTIIRRGQEAREKLFASNIRFALFAARASMGIVVFSKKGKLRGNAETGFDDISDSGSRGDGSYVGSYADIRQLAQPSAELADREQIALEEMWKATAVFKPKLNESGKPSARFATLALYHIQAGIHKYAQEVEDGGWNLKLSPLEAVRKASGALDEIERITGKPVTAADKWGVKRIVMGVGGLTRKRYDYSDPRAVLAGRKTGGFPFALGHIPEEEDVYSGQVPLEFADLVPNSDGVEDKMFREQFEKALNDALDTLSDREADVLRRRFGLYDGYAWTLDRIAKVYEVTRERIRKIENGALSKLRHSSRSDSLRHFHDYAGSEADGVTTGTLLGATNDGFPNIKTHRVKTALVPENHPPILESWQVDQEDAWDKPVRMSPEETARRFEEEAEVCAHMVEQLVGGEWWAFLRGASPTKVRNLSSEIVEQLGTVYAPMQVEYVWNNHFTGIVERIVRRAEREGKTQQVDLDAVVELFNQLINAMGDAYTMTLDVPEGFEGRLNGVGHGLRNAAVVINGDVGERLGHAAGRNASIVVNGNAGDLVGYETRVNAAIYVKGDVGDYCGAHITGNDVGIEVDGDAGEAVGYESKQGIIKIGQTFKSVMAEGVKVTDGALR